MIPIIRTTRARQSSGSFAMTADKTDIRNLSIFANNLDFGNKYNLKENKSSPQILTDNTFILYV